MAILKKNIVKGTMACLLGAFLVGGTPALADDHHGGGPIDAAEEEKEEEEDRFQFRGYQSTSYSFNSNNPSSRTNSFRVYDGADRELNFDLLNLDFQYNVDRPGNIGFRIDTTLGSTHPNVDAAVGLFRDENTGISNTNFDLRQAYVTYMTNNGIRFDIGKFGTHIGFEVFDGVDGPNLNATRSFAFAFGPFTHTGAKVSYEFNEYLAASLTLTNGWDQFTNVNDSLTWGGQITYTPVEDVSINFNYISGAENADNDSDNRTLFDVAATWDVHDRIHLGTNLLWGSEENGGLAGQNADWNGAVLYLGTDVTDDFHLNFRYEWFNDSDGNRTGTSQNLRGFTISPAYDINENWLVRADLRFDNSNVPTFLRGSDPASAQSTLFLNNVLRF